jgi:formylglycine-generating enzyme required for sulfatase activity
MGVEPHFVGCREETTWPVCSKTLGNTAQGVCDMTGTVIEWVADEGHDSYEGAPTDGSAWVASDEPTTRIARGGSIATRDLGYLTTTVRFIFDPAQPRYVLGARCAR